MYDAQKLSLSIFYNSLFAEISNSQILDEFCSHTTVVFNGNRILASVYGSFALVRGHKILAYIHVVPKDVCREHKYIF